MSSKKPPTKRLCKCGCKQSIAHMHPNAKFLTKKHKDNYWNAKGPRGKMGAYAAIKKQTKSQSVSRRIRKDWYLDESTTAGYEAMESGWDGHKNV